MLGSFLAPAASPYSSTLYRLVDLASRILRQAAPTRGHLASRYAEFLGGLTNLIVVGSTTVAPSGEADPMLNSEGDGDGVDSSGIGHISEQDWNNLWQSLGMEQDWLFGNIDFSNGAS